MTDLNNVDHYYNQFDSSKQYTEMLFRSGKVLQSKELNELQSIIKDQIKNVGDTILTNGDIIEGCQLIIDGTSVTLTKGRIYLNGNIRSIPDTQLTIRAKGTETIGVLLRNDVITPDDDTSLLDTAEGYDNYNQDGAYRLKEYVEITLDNSDASTLYTLVDGQQLVVNTAEDLTQLEKINATLARRTFDESGNYKVSGLNLVSKNYGDDDHVYITLESGKAYVKGYEVSKTTSQTIALDRVSSLRQTTNEPKIFRDGSNSYQLNNDYVNDVSKIVAIVQKQQSLTRGSIIGGIDYLPLTPVVEIVSVTQGETTYTQGVDYQLTSDGVDWSLGGSTPNPGESYTVVWSYNKTMKKDEDYTLVKSEDGSKGSIRFNDSGDLPVDGSTFLANYDCVLCRRDVIALNQDGKVIVTAGQPDILRTVESPSVDSEEVLILGSVLQKPNTNEVLVINSNIQSVSMLDLYKMLERLNNLEYNIAVSDLDKETADGENANDLVGILTDGFLGLTKSDVYHSEWSASIDPEENELTVQSQSTLHNLEVNKASSSNYGKFARNITAPYNEFVSVDQPLATDIMRVNSYNAFPQLASVQVSPAVDNWIDETVVNVENNATGAVSLRRWWYHKGEPWAQAEKQKWIAYGYADGGESLGWSGTTANTTKTTKTVVDTAIKYMRQLPVYVTVQNLEPDTDNIVATFDGLPIKLNAQQSRYQGTTQGSLRSDSLGIAKGEFTVPANTLCGTKELKVYPVSTPSLAGATSYTAEGTTRKTTNNVLNTTTRLNPYDPLAQSFQFEVDQFLTSVGIYFKDKSAKCPVTVQVRNMVNGYPSTTVYAEKIVYPSEIALSENGTAETKVVFDTPVFCRSNEQYCFTVLSNSDVDSLFIAETTKKDLVTSAQIVKNPYLNGVLFSSSNALTWTAHQSTDMKFKLYCAKFEPTSSIVFTNVENVSYDRLMVMADELVPIGCSIKWQYRINNSEWLPIEAYVDRDLDELAENVEIKADFTSTNFTSPVIASDNLSLVGFLNEKTGTYISKNVAIADGYNHVKVVVDLHIPANTNVNLYFATDVNGNTWTPLESTNSVRKSSTYETFTFEKDLEASYKNYRCKLVLSTNDPTKRPKAKDLRNILTEV